MATGSEIVQDGFCGNRPTPQTQGARDCAICFCPMTSEDINVPRLLTCGHTFCTECIRKIYLASTDAYNYRRRMEREILCPHCKTPCLIPDGDASKLPKNYILLDIISEQPRIKVDVERITCNIHNIVKKSYCFNCQELVCPYCQMSHHQGHNCEITIEAIKVFLTDFKQHEERLEAYAQQLKSAKDKFQATLYRLKENKREASHHINLRFTAIIEEASKWKNINIRKLEDITKEREDILEQQIESLDSVIDETEQKLDLARRVTSPQNEEEFFIHHTQIVNDSKVLISKELGLQPLVHEHIEWRVDPINHIIDYLNRIAFVNEDANAAPSAVKSPPQSIEPITDAVASQKPIVNIPASIPTLTLSPYQSPISTPHSYPSSQVQAYPIQQMHPLSQTARSSSAENMLMGRSSGQPKMHVTNPHLTTHNSSFMPVADSSLSPRPRPYPQVQSARDVDSYRNSYYAVRESEENIKPTPHPTGMPPGDLSEGTRSTNMYDRSVPSGHIYENPFCPEEPTI
ncbi:hypothetical protein LOD99_4147 [Oopsacas minuta]|uniref:RING-type domain-containing protein n=1 Tax=Oopsacas minuta TaxID=111878 RepID=A0AAV7JV42_9METZ|nr:hypothetical protein LOD99_4147 [Oopsacas minuta]